MRIFVTGAEGQIARSLKEGARADSTLTLICSSRPEFDLMRPETIGPQLRAFSPDLVVNAAAYTAVDAAESDSGAAFAVNRDGAGEVAAAAAAIGAPIIQISTDYVFDGMKGDPYVEDDPVGPLSIYGRSKLEGEQAVAKANEQHMILRTAWVYSPFGKNFVRTMLRLTSERDRLNVVDDQRGCPTYAPDIAEAILAISRRIASGGWRPEYASVTHLAGPNALTWCAFARVIVAGAAARGGRMAPIYPIPTREFPTPARRPANSCLETSRLADVFNVNMPPLESSLARCLDRLIGMRDRDQRSSV